MKKQGSCGCGAVQYSFEANKPRIINCHCSMCRAFNGAAFSTYVIIPADSFSFRDEAAHLASYCKENATKFFCRECGSPVFNSHAKYQTIRLIHFGSIHDSSDIQPKLNVWCENHLQWSMRLDQLKNFEHGMA
ncbi:MAG: GFA family protein [Gammaproteobacteria bacterium]|nr:GFA family protein [Gammaproteobacteria bacterium]